MRKKKILFGLVVVSILSAVGFTASLMDRSKGFNESCGTFVECLGQSLGLSVDNNNNNSNNNAGNTGGSVPDSQAAIVSIEDINPNVDWENIPISQAYKLSTNVSGEFLYPLNIYDSSINNTNVDYLYTYGGISINIWSLASDTTLKTIRHWWGTVSRIKVIDRQETQDRIVDTLVVIGNSSRSSTLSIYKVVYDKNSGNVSYSLEASSNIYYYLGKEIFTLDAGILRSSWKGCKLLYIPGVYYTYTSYNASVFLYCSGTLRNLNGGSYTTNNRVSPYGFYVSNNGSVYFVYIEHAPIRDYIKRIKLEAVSDTQLNPPNTNITVLGTIDRPYALTSYIYPVRSLSRTELCFLYLDLSLTYNDVKRNKMRCYKGLDASTVTFPNGVTFTDYVLPRYSPSLKGAFVPITSSKDSSGFCEYDLSGTGIANRVRLYIGSLLNTCPTISNFYFLNREPLYVSKTGTSYVVVKVQYQELTGTYTYIGKLELLPDGKWNFEGFGYTTANVGAGEAVIWEPGVLINNLFRISDPSLQ